MSFPRRAYRLVLLGPPGVGKGTQAQLLCRHLGMCHLATGDLFRSAQCQANPSPALRAAREHMRRGELVPDDLVIAMVRERHACLRCDGGFLLDGFPRTVPQAEACDELLTELGVTLDGVISYELPVEQIVDRLSGRRVCSRCQATYHMSVRPPRVEMQCDRCSGELCQREDDRPEVIRNRMRAYAASTEPLIAYYRERGILISITADDTPEAILEQTLHLLHEQAARPARVAAVPKARA